MPVTYTNRKGFTYFLCKGITKTGKPRYYFAREQKGQLVDEIPQGFQIQESVNGIVSLVKTRPQLILPKEISSVEAVLKRHPKGNYYRISIKKNQIIIYERLGPDADTLLDIFGQAGLFTPRKSKEQVEEFLNRSAQYTPVMRFILDDRKTRQYHAERWSYYGNIDDWIYAGHSGGIGELAKKLIPTLGTDKFYELY
jgi:hypothetical protein